MVGLRSNALVLIGTFLILSSLLNGCTADVDAATEDALTNLIDMGFDRLVAPSVIETEEGTRIHTLTLGPSNLFLIESDEGVVLVDAGIPALDRIVLAYLNYIGRDDLKLIFITHAHPDHYGSAAALRETTGAEIAVHEADAAEMAAGEFQLGTVRDWEWASELTVPAVERALSQLEPTPPDILLADGDRLDEFGIDAYVVHTPGHTPGSSVLMLEDAYAFVGDLASNVGDPHAQSSYADSWPEVAASLRHVQALAPTLVFAGHGADPMTDDEFSQLQPTFSGE